MKKFAISLILLLGLLVAASAYMKQEPKPEQRSSAPAIAVETSIGEVVKEVTYEPRKDPNGLLTNQPRGTIKIEGDANAKLPADIQKQLTEGVAQLPSDLAEQLNEGELELDEEMRGQLREGKVAVPNTETVNPKEAGSVPPGKLEEY